MADCYVVSHVDPRLSLAAHSVKIYAKLDRSKHFELRYDQCLPLIQSKRSEPAQRLVAAYVCHEPYRSVVVDARLHPFREAILNVARDATTDNGLATVLLQLIQASADELLELASRPVSSVLGERQNTKVVGPSALLAKATDRVLSMAEQRSLLSNLEAAPMPLQVQSSIDPTQLGLIAANHPNLIMKLIAKVSQECMDDRSLGLETLQSYLEPLRRLPPTRRSFDIVVRLLTEGSPSPAPLSTPGLATTIAHIARVYVLGPFITNSISVLERVEAQQEAMIVADFNESGLYSFDRRQVEKRLEAAMARQVTEFCHFVTSLLNAALVYPPDLGFLRRSIAVLPDDALAASLREEVQRMDDDLASMTEATLIELKHFALRFGRYGDGTRLYSQLSTMAS